VLVAILFSQLEAIRSVLEIKSTWNAENLADIKEKCRCITSLRAVPDPTITDHIASMKKVIKSIYTMEPAPAYILETPRIGMAAIIFNGGEKFKAIDITQEEIEEIDSAWPDAILLLSVGKVIRKSARSFLRSPKNLRPYERKSSSFTSSGWLEFLNVKEDALLVFTSALLELLRNRTTLTEAPFYLERYISQILTHSPLGSLETEYTIEFPIFPSPYPARLWNPQ